MHYFEWTSVTEIEKFVYFSTKILKICNFFFVIFFFKCHVNNISPYNYNDCRRTESENSACGHLKVSGGRSDLQPPAYANIGRARRTDERVPDESGEHQGNGRSKAHHCQL